MTVAIASIPAVDSSPEKIKAQKVIQLVSLLHRKYTHEISHCVSRMQKFKENIDKDPAHAFEWSDEYFQVAANHKVASILAASISGENFSLYAMRDYLMGSILSGARHPASSTSQASNVFEQRKLAAFTEAYRVLAGYMELLD